MFKLFKLRIYSLTCIIIDNYVNYAVFHHLLLLLYSNSHTVTLTYETQTDTKLSQFTIGFNSYCTLNTYPPVHLELIIC